MWEPGGALRVVLTGAFSTGMPLRVPVGEYKTRQEQLGEALASVDRTTWNPEGVKWLEQPSYDEGGGGYSNLVPLVLIQREGEELGAELGRLEALDGTRSKELAGWSWTIDKAFVQLFDLGVGVIVGAYRVTPPAELPAAKVAETVREWCNLTRDEQGRVRPPVGAAYECVARVTAERFRRAVGEKLEDLCESELPLSLGGSRDRRDDEKARAREVGRLKWLHPVFVLPCGTDRARDDEVAEQFEAVQSGRADIYGGVFRPGVKRSVIQVEGTGRAESPEAELKKLFEPSAPLGLITLNWAYYATFMDFDRGLLAALDEMHEREDGSLSSLEDDAYRTYQRYVTVAEARARLDSALNGLGPGQMAQWEEIARVTRFDQLLKTVERKLEVLETVAESRVQRAAAKSSQRNRRVLTVLTILTVFTVGFAAIAHFAGDRADTSGHLTARWIALGAAAVLGGVGLIYAEIEALRRLFQRLRGEDGGRPRQRKRGARRPPSEAR